MKKARLGVMQNLVDSLSLKLASKHALDPNSFNKQAKDSPSKLKRMACCDQKTRLQSKLQASANKPPASSLLLYPYKPTDDSHPNLATTTRHSDSNKNTQQQRYYCLNATHPIETTTSPTSASSTSFREEAHAACPTECNKNKPIAACPTTQPTLDAGQHSDPPASSPFGSLAERNKAYATIFGNFTLASTPQSSLLEQLLNLFEAQAVRVLGIFAFGYLDDIKEEAGELVLVDSDMLSQTTASRVLTLDHHLAELEAHPGRLSIPAVPEGTGHSELIRAHKAFFIPFELVHFLLGKGLSPRQAMGILHPWLLEEQWEAASAIPSPYFGVDFHTFRMSHHQNLNWLPNHVSNKTTVEALDDDENNPTADHRMIDYARRSIKPIALDTPIAISPSKDRITSSPDLIFPVYTPRDTIFCSNNNRLTPFCLHNNVNCVHEAKQLGANTNQRRNENENATKRKRISLLHHPLLHSNRSFDTTPVFEVQVLRKTSNLLCRTKNFRDSSRLGHAVHATTTIKEGLYAFLYPLLLFLRTNQANLSYPHQPLGNIDSLATFLHDSFDVPKESHSTLCEALIASQYRTWSDFLFIDDIDDLTYQDGDWEERDHYTKEAFKEYWRGIVKANRDSTANRVVVATHGIPPDEPGRSTKPIDQLKYESWIRKPRDETTFPVLQQDARFEHWLVKFTATLETSDIDTHTFLDPDWPRTALTGYSKALHDKQCAFFWTLLRHVFQGDFSSSCVLYHQRTRDGRQAYFDFVKLRNPVSPPMPPAAPVSTHAPVHSTSSTPAVHNSPPITVCKTPDHPTVDNPETPRGPPGSSNPGPAADSTSTGTPSYTWKYFPSTDSVCFRRIAYSSTPSIVPADIPTGDVPSKRNRESHSPRARASYPPPTNSRWTFYPQSETVVFHRPHKPVTFPQSTCISSLPLPPSGALSKDSVVPSSVHAYSQYGAYSYQVRKPIYGAHGAPTCPFRKPFYSAYSMTYDLPAVCITKRHRDAIKLKLYHLHATLLLANWIYDDAAAKGTNNKNNNNSNNNNNASNPGGHTSSGTTLQMRLTNNHRAPHLQDSNHPIVNKKVESAKTREAANQAMRDKQGKGPLSRPDGQERCH
eukprot:jgi/Psemu1/54298/gm1.54298_g